MADHQAEPKLTVYRGWPTQGNHVWSPFVVKLEAQLRFTGIAYKAAAGSPMEAPKGKIPYVEMPVMPTKVDGTMTTTEKMGDSTLIIKHLVGAGSLPDLNAQLSPEGKAADLATRALLEDKLYFFHRITTRCEIMYSCPSLPWPVRVLVGQMVVYRSTKAMLYGQGTLRLIKKEVRDSKREVWQTISDALVSSRSKSDSSDGPSIHYRPFWFLGGKAPTEVDATLFGFIVSVFLRTADPESREIVKEYPMLEDNAKRIHDTYFPDYDKWASF